MIATLVPIYLIFALGILLRKTSVLPRDAANVLLKVNFYVSLPALAMRAIMNVELSQEYAILPFIAPVLVLLTFGISWSAGRALRLPPSTLGTFFVGTLVMNITFMYPVAQGLYGADGIGKIAIFDVGQGFMTFSFAYFMACRCSQQTGPKQFRNSLANVCKSPPMWGILIGTILNLLHLSLPPFLTQTLLFLGNAATPLIMLSMGMLFSFQKSNVRVLAPAILIRMVGGSVLGLLCATLFGLQGETREIVILVAAAPAGHNTLTFSALQHLDTELAASLVPLSALFSILYIPLLLTLLAP